MKTFPKPFMIGGLMLCVFPMRTFVKEKKTEKSIETQITGDMMNTFNVGQHKTATNNPFCNRIS